MRGSGLNYAWRVGLWTVFVFVTLGIALPWRQAALERFKMRHTAYGHLQGRFDGTGGQLFKRGWGLWLTLVILLPSPFVFGGILQSPVAVGLCILVIVFVLPFVYAFYRSIEWRWWIAGLRLGDVHFESGMDRGALVDLYWKVTGWTLLLGLGLSIWSGAAWGIGFSFIGGAGTVEQKMLLLSQSWGFLIAIALGYVVSILAFWTVMRIYLIHDVWKRVADSVTVHNLATAAEVAAQGEMAGAIGEGLADSLDVVGF
jgi:uncharacterized membrane protein YjgN (DUF898 family)